MSTEPNPNPLQNAPKTHDQPSIKTNQDYNNKPPLPTDPDLTKTLPEADIPVIKAEEEKEDNTGVDSEKFSGIEGSTYLDIIDE